MEVAEGRVVTLEYTVRLDDGDLLDSTGGCGPIVVLHGSGQLFAALEHRMVGMRPGETREVEIPADEAYGPRRTELVRDIPRDRLPPGLELQVGQDYRLTLEGRSLRFRLLEVGADHVRADFNPRTAGQGLRATVTVISVRPPTDEEARRGRV